MSRMRKSWWKVNTERDEHLLLLGFALIYLTILERYINTEMLKEYLPIASAGLVVSSLWVFIWVFRRGKLIRLPKRTLHIWMWVNAILSVAVIAGTIGTIFFSW